MILSRSNAEKAITRHQKFFLRLIAVFLTIFSYSQYIYAETGLPWSSSFETGDLSEWNGYSRNITLSNTGAYDGSWATRIELTANTENNNYLEHYFGDHIRTNLDKVEELYFQFYTKFDSGYTWHNRQSHKLAIINLTNGVDSQRRYQVYVWVTPGGDYRIDHTDMDDWLFYSLDQNVGTPTPVTFDVWEKIKVYVRQNSPGANDGIVRMWINNELKLDYSDLNLRENTDYGMNKLILSSLSNPTGGNGFQWSDAWSLSETDPDVDSSSNTVPKPPVLVDVETIE